MAAVVVLVSSIIYMAPVDPALMTFGQMADKAAIEAKRQSLGLDQPLPWRVLGYLNDVSPISAHKDTPQNADSYGYWRLLPLGGNVLVLKTPHMGDSYQSGKPVGSIIGEALPQTMILAVAAILIGLLLGIPLGIAAALKHNTLADRSIVFFSTFGVSLPSYVTGILVAYAFGVLLSAWTGLDHFGSLFDYDDNGHSIIRWRNLILPAFALGLRPLSQIVQLTRSAMLDVLSQDFIRTARAKGLSRARVIGRHALRNALTPVVTATSGWFASLLTGAVFVERVFNYNGLGNVLIDHLLSFDIPVVLGISLFMALVFLVVNLLADYFNTLIDPRAA